MTNNKTDWNDQILQNLFTMGRQDGDLNGFVNRMCSLIKENKTAFMNLNPETISLLNSLQIKSSGTPSLAA